jgi:hypothetical protein
MAGKEGVSWYFRFGMYLNFYRRGRWSAMWCFVAYAMLYCAGLVEAMGSETNLVIMRLLLYCSLDNKVY